MFNSFCLLAFFSPWDYCIPSRLSQIISFSRDEILLDINKINQKNNQPLEESSSLWGHPVEESWRNLVLGGKFEIILLNKRK